MRIHRQGVAQARNTNRTFNTHRTIGDPQRHEQNECLPGSPTRARWADGEYILCLITPPGEPTRWERIRERTREWLSGEMSGQLAIKAAASCIHKRMRELRNDPRYASETEQRRLSAAQKFCTES
jgi:hypothetical protein